MSNWELFTWISTWIMALGSIVVFVLFLWQLPEMLRRIRRENDSDETD